MREKLLKSIIQLLAIVAIEDDVSDHEIASIREFLDEHVGNKAAETYLSFFLETISHLKEQKPDHATLRNMVIELSKGLNSEFTQKQKLVVLIDLLELIIADGKISDRELKWLYLIGTELRFSKKIIDYVGAFALGDSRDSFGADCELVADDGSPNIEAKHMKVDRLQGSLVFFRLPRVETYYVKYLGKNTLYLNGIPMRENRIWPFPLGSSIKGADIKTIYFSEISSSFLRDDEWLNISFVAENISYKFKNGNIGLQDINFSEPYGKLIGIMGGSGAGKSTLFNVLNGNELPTTGNVRINGLDLHKERQKLNGVIGYVPQDDLLIEDLSVFENLFYAAKLCFADLSNKDIETLVNKTLVALGLAEIGYLKIGNAIQKTISGGQRKRLNIGLELLREPNVLFVDEPTSGLSSRDSENIMDLLKELSIKGKMVFVVIHQPSSDIYKMFDKLLILDVGGYQIYYGNPVEAITYFKEITEVLDKEHDECPSCGNVNPEQIFNIIETRLVDEFGQLSQERRYQPEEWHDHYKKRIVHEPIKESTENPPANLHIPNKIKQLQIFITRDVIAKLSNTQYMIINVLEAPILALLLAIVVRYSPPGAEYIFRTNNNIPAFFFMSVIVALFMGLTISAEEIIRDRKILKRESFLHLSRMSYLLSKTVILFTISAIQTILFVVIGDMVLEIESMTLTYFMVLFSVSCFANMLGLNISSAFNSAVTIYILIPLLVIPQLILSGVVVGFDKLNPIFTTEEKVPMVGELMASRWAYEALAVAQFKDNDFEKMFYEKDRQIAQGEYKTIYYIPYLEGHLDYCHLHLSTQDKEMRRQMAEKLNLVRNEIKKELVTIGPDKFSNIEKLTLSTFDTKLYNESMNFLKALKKYYNNKRNHATRDKDHMIAEISRSPEEKKAFLAQRDRHQNESIIQLLKNTTSDIRIIEQDGQLIQKVYPIYAKNDYPTSIWNFRTNFYYPEKYFLGIYFNTPGFNVFIIWMMTLTLFIMLYYDLLRKLITFKF